jgi:hypothetical protein
VPNPTASDYMAGASQHTLPGTSVADPDPDPCLNKWLYINFFGVCKSHKYFRNLCFLNFWVKTVESRIWIRIRSKIVRSRNTGNDQAVRGQSILSMFVSMYIHVFSRNSSYTFLKGEAVCPKRASSLLPHLPE